MGDSASKEFAEEVLQCHNEYRRKHQAPPLVLSRKLTKQATRYARRLSTTRIITHTVFAENCGENLGYDWYELSGKDISDRWYNEVKQYDFNKPQFTANTGHFSAMVWRSTTKLGVGKAMAEDGMWIVVARYFPAGNMSTQEDFENNVLPAKPLCRRWSHFNGSQRHSCSHFNTETSEKTAKTEIQQDILGSVERPL